MPKAAVGLFRRIWPQSATYFPQVAERLLNSGRFIRVRIEDDGQGFKPVEGKKTFGLLGMQERVKILGGSIQISSQQGKGSCIDASFPKREVAAP